MNTSSMTFSNQEPYQSIEGNVRVGEDEVICCFVCHDEAVVISNDGKKGLCWDHYSMLCESMSPDD